MSRPSNQRFDDVLIMALACGASAEQAALRAGCCERTVRRRLANPDFSERLRQFRADMLQQTAGVLIAATHLSVKTLVAAQAEGLSPGVRLAAARTVLEREPLYRQRADLVPRLQAFDSLKVSQQVDDRDGRPVTRVERTRQVAIRRHRRDDALLAALASGSTMVSAARMAGCCERTVRRRLALPAFRERLQQLRTELLERTAAMLTAVSLESAKTIVTLHAENVPPRVRVGAARLVLALAPEFHNQVGLDLHLRRVEERLERSGLAVAVEPQSRSFSPNHTGHTQVGRLQSILKRAQAEAEADAEGQRREALIAIRDALSDYPGAIHDVAEWMRTWQERPLTDPGSRSPWRAEFEAILARYPGARETIEACLTKKSLMAA